ncbi:MAG: 50S ribosomal protein L10 [Desulfobacterales bacterium]|nr:50S ribosomal protein L10 [Desulfobacterales bacterium]
MDRRTKEQVAAELHEKLKNAKMAVITNFSGLSVGKMEELRNALRKSDAELKVVKNTLLRIASRETPYRLLEEHFKGPLAITLNHGDIVQATKVLVEFTKKNAEVEIRGGMLGGKFLNREQLGMFAELPSREILLGKLLSIFVAVQTSLVNVLSAVPRSFVQVLDAYRVKKES